MLPIISWKNVWRNKTRSLVVIIAMMIGVFSGTFIIALATGVVDSRSQSIVNEQTAHIQIHHPKYPDYQEINYIIPNAFQKLDSIKALPYVESACLKYKSMVMSKTANEPGGMFLSAIDPSLDTTVFQIHKTLTDGESSYFGEDISRPIVISQKLAKKHKLEYYEIDSADVQHLEMSTLPDSVKAKVIALKGEKFKKKKNFSEKLKVILTEKEYFLYKNKIQRICAKYTVRKKINITTISYDSINKTSMYRVAGYYKTNDAMFDEMNGFVLYDDFQKHANLPENSAHEIDILVKDKLMLDSTKLKLEAMFPNLKVETYREIRPDVAMNEAMMSVYTLIIMVIILFALSFGIINTMLMAVLERTKEIGMLKAIGMNRKRVFFMIMYETIYLGLVGGVVGMVVGYFSITSLGKNGIHLSMFQEGFEAMGYSSILYPKLEPIFFFQVTFLVVLTGVLSAIIPARKALRLNPADAIRSDV